MTYLSDHDLLEIRQELMKFAEIGVFRYDMTGTVLFMDRETLRILELDTQYPDSAQVTGMNIADLFEYVMPPRTLRDRVEQTDEVRGFEYRFRTLSGRMKWCLHDLRRIVDSETGRPAVQVITRDITGLKKVQEQLEESNRGLAQANAELQTLDEMKTNLLANVSHELRSPLVTIRGYADLLQAEGEEPVTPKQRRQLKVIINNVDRLAAIVDDLLESARIDSGQERLQLGKGDLNGLIEAAQVSLEPKRVLRDVRLIQMSETENLEIEADLRLIGQLLTNLLNNAIKFTDAGGRVVVSTTLVDDDQVRITVEDSGIGIPPESLDRIFGRFYQVDTSSTRSYTGLGLGLSICRDVVQRHHGTIGVESRLGRGTTFTVTLPRYQSHP